MGCFKTSRFRKRGPRV
jgi:hypothetical protein